MGSCAATEEPTIEGRRKDISRCELRVNGTIPVVCILDSAASTFLVSKAFLEEIDVPIKQRRMQDVLVADGGTMSVAGIVDLELEIGPVRVVHQFEVTENFTFPILLGWDF